MNFKKALVIFRKEILEMLRDRRTLFATIVLPVVLYPVLFIGFSAIMSRQTLSARRTRLRGDRLPSGAFVTGQPAFAAASRRFLAASTDAFSAATKSTTSAPLSASSFRCASARIAMPPTRKKRRRRLKN